MIPRFAALSIAEMMVRIPSTLGMSAERTCFCIVRRRATTLRLRSDRFNVWRARLAADFVLAIAYSKNCGRGRSRSQLRLSRMTLARRGPIGRDDRQRTHAESADSTLMREDSCFGRSSRRCSALASLSLSGEPDFFVALQRARPPFAFARP